MVIKFYSFDYFMVQIFKPGLVRHRSAYARFLEIALVYSLVCVCVPAPKDINN